MLKEKFGEYLTKISFEYGESDVLVNSSIYHIDCWHKNS
jgi:hypothetical protein